MRTYTAFSRVMIAACSCICLGCLGADKPYRGKAFLGLGLHTVELPKDDRYTSSHGLKVTRVAAASSGEKAGLLIGDVVVSINGAEWKGPEIRLSRSFGKDGKKAMPGEVVRLSVLRRKTDRPDDKGELIEVDMTLLPYPGTRAETPHTPTNDELRPDLKDVHPDYESLCWKLIDACGFRSDCEDVLGRLARCEEYPDPHRLAVCRYVHRDAFKLESVAREIVDPVAACSSAGVSEASPLLAHVTGVLVDFGSGKPTPSPDRSPALEGTDLASHLAHIEAVLKAAAERHAKAFSALSEDEVKFMRSHRGAMLDSYIESRMLSYDSDRDRQQASVRLLDLATKVDVPALLAQAELAARLTTPEFTTSLRAALEGAGKNLDANVVVRHKTPHGAIVISGRGRQRHADQNCAVLYDLGGDDVYANFIATPKWGAIPTAIVVDCDGNDAYESWEPFTQGCGDFGVGLLVDLKGDDSYVGMRFAQGVSFCGVGMLFDEAGDDVYRVIELGQGIGHWGVGLLADRAGDDRYESHDTSQGVGLPGGLGLLCDGGDGADRYYCKGKEPTGYGHSPGVFEGWGQGMGVGYRPYASGGVGVLYDAAGRDRIEGGNFSQGGGYFYALGVLYNGGRENDVYIGSRYAQGFGCHQAGGVMIEEGGDDLYTTRQFVAQGLAWDEAVALFRDEAGNDRYEGGGFSHGASAMNGWTLFIECGGKDTYLYTDQARAGGNSYHGGTSLSFFLDLGGEDDDYPSKHNNEIVQGGERSIFVDLPGSVAEALAKDAWRALLPKPKQPE